MFLDLEIAMSTCVSYDFMYLCIMYFIYRCYVFKNVGILVFMNLIAVLLAQFFVVEPNF